MDQLTTTSRRDATTHVRTFTAEDLSAFAELLDDGAYREVLDQDADRGIVHELLLATLPLSALPAGTGHLVTRSLSIDFVRPAYTDEPITCSVDVETDDRDGKRVLTGRFVCRGPEGDAIARGDVEAVSYGPDPASRGVA